MKAFCDHRAVCVGLILLSLLTFTYSLRTNTSKGSVLQRYSGNEELDLNENSISPSVEATNEISISGGAPSSGLSRNFGDKTCALPLTSNFSDVIVPLKRHEDVSFVLQKPRKRTLLNERLLEDDTTFLFIHVNKAGGTLFKEDVFNQAARQRKWDGVGYGSTVGWQQLLRCKQRSHQSAPSSADALTCGKYTSLLPCGPLGGGKCPLRLIWGTHAMGMCQLYPRKPCVMAIVLREPVQRMISQYNYVCVEGKEDRKKWSTQWREANRCPLTLLQFIQTDLTSKTFLIDHLARAADPVCAMDIALNNLFHPCVRYLLLDKLSDGLMRLSQAWGPAMRPYFDRVARLAASGSGKRNSSPYEARLKIQTDDPAVMAKLREELKDDIAFYAEAVKNYEAQWNHPLESCNSMP